MALWGVSSLEMAVQRPIPANMTEKVSSWGFRDELQSWTWPGLEGTNMTVNL